MIFRKRIVLRTFRPPPSPLLIQNQTKEVGVEMSVEETLAIYLKSFYFVTEKERNA